MIRAEVPILTDGVVTLRGHREDDLERVFEQSIDPLMVEWTLIPVPYTREDARRFVREIAPGGWRSDEAWIFAVEHAGRYAGTVDLRHRGDGRAELAYAAHPSARGTGVMARALRLLLEWGFETRRLEQVHWYALRGNWPSRRLAWKLGFRFEGLIRKNVSQRGVLREEWVATLLREDDRAPAGRWLQVPRLPGERVLLRPLEERDAPRLVEARRDPVTRHWLARTGATPVEDDPDGRAFLLEKHERAAEGSGVYWSVADAVTDTHLGLLAVMQLEEQSRPEIGWWLHPDARRRGYAREAATLAIRHAFAEPAEGGLGCHRLRASISRGNAPSLATGAALGMTLAGTERRGVLLGDGSYDDEVVLELLREDGKFAG